MLFTCLRSLTDPHPALCRYHDNIHDVVGGRYGTMHFVPIASFDPIFWFHHQNVERLFVLWQLMNPDKWIEPSEVVQEDTMSTVLQEVVNGSTPVLPFRGPSGEYVTGDSLRDIRSLTSNFDDAMEYIDRGLTPDQIKDEVIRTIFQDGDYKDAFSVTYNVKMNVNSNDLPSPGGILHVFLLPDEQPSLTVNFTDSPSYCGSVNIMADSEVLALSLDDCMRQLALNFYQPLNCVQPPWGEEDMLDPTRRFAAFDVIQNQWSVKPENFAFVVEGPDVEEYSEFVAVEPLVEYTYSSGEKSYKNVASEARRYELLPDQLTAAADPSDTSSGAFPRQLISPSGWTVLALGVFKMLVV